MHSMSVQQTLQNEIEHSKRWLDIEKDDSTYKRDLQKLIELVNWVLDNMKNPDIFICEIIETKMNEIIDKINQLDDAIEADTLHSGLRILDWIFYQVCCKEIKIIAQYKEVLSWLAGQTNVPIVTIPENFRPWMININMNIVWNVIVMDLKIKSEKL